VQILIGVVQIDRGRA
jgi:hypothetical protein